MKWLSASAERRKWMNVTLSQSDKNYLEALMSYMRQLRQRNAFLKNGKPVKMRTDLLSVYNLRMAPSLEVIRTGRAGFIERVNPVFHELYKRISGGSEEVGLEYQPDIVGDPNLVWEDSWPFDTAAKRTTRGAHKDDVRIDIHGQDAKSFASQGQRKSILLAARLAQYHFLNDELGEKPLLLLDDIFDKLDPSRISALIDLIGGDDFGQVLLTDTEPERLARIFDEKGVPYYHYLVEDGNYKRI
jgi:DNA replication and repair protein RecF